MIYYYLPSRGEGTFYEGEGGKGKNPMKTTKLKRRGHLSSKRKGGEKK